MRGRRYDDWIIEVLALLLIAFLLFLVTGVANGNQSLGKKHLSDSKKKIALTFDDGPKPNVLKDLLPVLADYDIKATFFVNGFRLKNDESAQSLIRQMIIVGHSIQNHTYSHGNLRKMEERYGRRWILSDIERNSVLIEKYSGRRPTFFRPPFWVIWPDLKKDIESHGYVVLTLENGDINSSDYILAIKQETQNKIIALVLGAIKQREKQGKYSHVLVFHELPGTVKILPRLIEELESRGYGFDTIENIYNQKSKEGR